MRYTLFYSIIMRIKVKPVVALLHDENTVGHIEYDSSKMSVQLFMFTEYEKAKLPRRRHYWNDYDHSNNPR